MAEETTTFANFQIYDPTENNSYSTPNNLIYPLDLHHRATLPRQDDLRVDEHGKVSTKSPLITKLFNKNPHLRNSTSNLRLANPNRIDLDEHEREHRPERFPQVYNIASVMKNNEQNAHDRKETRNLNNSHDKALAGQRGWGYNILPRLMKVVFGTFISGYDSLGVIGSELIMPTVSILEDDKPESAKINFDPDLFNRNNSTYSSPIPSLDSNNPGSLPLYNSRLMDQYTFQEPEILIRISYTLVQLAQNVLSFLLKAFFLPRYLDGMDSSHI